MSRHSAIGSGLGRSIAARCARASSGVVCSTGGSPSESADGGGGADLTIVDFSFSPAELSVSEGQTISVTNIGENSHTFTTDDEAIDETIGASGGFHCRFHSQMTGTLTVG